MIRAFFLIFLPFFAICQEPFSYLCLDNQTVADEIELAIDPFLILRTKITSREEPYSIESSCEVLVDKIKPCTSKNIFYEEDGSLAVAIKKQSRGVFEVECNFPAVKLWWQVSESPFFETIVSNLDQIVPFTPKVTLEPIDETFLNPNCTYYFRAKAIYDSTASPWSEPLLFISNKPERVQEIEFKKIAKSRYQISWQKDPSPSTEYLIFASNSQDFIPSLYCEKQIDAILQDGEAISSPSYNLIAITPSNKIEIDGSLAYYRIIAVDKSQFSVPSELVYVFDNELYQIRDRLVLSENNEIKRNCYGILNSYSYFASVLKEYISHPYISAETWKRVHSYIIPHNHPIKSALDLMFNHKRITQSITTLQEAGFKTRGGPNNHSKTIFATHKALKGYVFKIIPDDFDADEVTRLLSRIDGARTVSEIIDRHNYHKILKVPKKWLYILPPEPSPLLGSIRKNFILIADDMNIYSREENYPLWKSFLMNHERLHAIYTVITEGGMNDCVYAFNIPFSKDGKIAFLDTEDHHKWPIHYQTLNKYLSPEMQAFWEQLYNK